MFNQQVPTVVSKSSQRIRAIVEPDPELEPLIPAEPELNLAAYSRFLEAVLRATMEG